ncbi:MAG TPA: HD domain-containing phosphohydrolase [Tepidiformaceae bacterium]
MRSISDASILVIDDHLPNLKLVEAMLRPAGHERLTLRSDAHDLPALLETVQPDLILLDLHMPAPDGFAVLAQLADLIPRDSFLPILVLTADNTEPAKERALGLGANDFVSKPVNRTELLLRIRNLLQTRLLHLQQQALSGTLEAKVRERTRQLEDAQLEILERLGLAADFRDDATGQHAKRVGSAAAMVAQSLGLPDATVELYRWAAPLHDIGKLAIPEAILWKPAALSEEEFGRICTHTTVGARILSGSKFPVLQLAEEMALTHHERWDGKGYMGRRWEEIPLSGRIVSPCDVFDALTHDRPYKPAWPVERAMDELRDLRGRAFEPRVVDVFFELGRQGIVGL